MVNMCKLDDVRKIIAAIRSSGVPTKGGTSLEEREAANALSRQVYRQLDACRTDLTNLIRETESDTGEQQDTAEIKGLRREVEDLAATLVIQPVQPKFWAIVSTIDVLWRAPACLLFVLFMGFVTSVPLIVLTMVEHQLYLLHRRWRSRRYSKGVGRQHPARSLQTSPAATVGGAAEAGLGLECGAGAGGSASLSSLIKRFDAWWILLIMGVSVQAEGLQECGLRRLGSPVMLLFSHVSTLDAMIILSTFPQAFCAVVKEELFALPVVGWIMASHGGVPINRRHRASAVQALAETGDRARELGLHIAMAPEGTRSKTGQLGPFKRGAMHMQEQLQWPVIPVTIRGAYELFPLKSYSNQCGKVIVRYHQPILASAVKSRDDLATRLRKEMLDAVAEEAHGAGHAMPPSSRFTSFTACAVMFWVTARGWRLIATFSRREGVDLSVLVAGGLAYMALSTMFVYFVYARRCFSSGGTGSPALAAEPSVRLGFTAGGDMSALNKMGMDKVNGESDGQAEMMRLLGQDQKCRSAAAQTGRD